VVGVCSGHSFDCEAEVFQLGDGRPPTAEFGRPKRSEIRVLMAVGSGHHWLGVVSPTVSYDDELPRRMKPVFREKRVATKLIELGQCGKHGLRIRQLIQGHRSGRSSGSVWR
jgi:hypothetical protein